MAKSQKKEQKFEKNRNKTPGSVVTTAPGVSQTAKNYPGGGRYNPIWLILWFFLRGTFLIFRVASRKTFV